MPHIHCVLTISYTENSIDLSQLYSVDLSYSSKHRPATALALDLSQLLLRPAAALP
jgi:hypothetical protein